MAANTSRVGVIDYGLGNVGSIRNVFRKIGVLSEVLEDPAKLASVDRAILPGIGHFDKGMGLLRDSGWGDAIREFTLVQAKPFLGICLGMQMLGRFSEEGDCPGLGIIDYDVRYFDKSRMAPPLPVPHMGWSVVRPKHQASLFRDFPADPRFYFVHSLHIVSNAGDGDVAAETDYGYNFCCSVQRENIFGVQFHPEKSHVYGMQLLNNFSSVSC